MKQAFLSVIALTVLASTASAQPMSPAYIQQIDGIRSATMTSMEIMSSVTSTVQGLSALRPASGNLAYTWQDGLWNNALIVQNGSGNVGLIHQIGAHNTASIQQIGSGHAAAVFQQGRGNVAIIRQR